MILILKNNESLICDDFSFKCTIGEGGKSENKKEGDKKTPKGTFSLGNLFYRADRKKKPETALDCRIIKKKWVGAMIPITKKNIINSLKLKKKIKFLLRNYSEKKLIMIISYQYTIIIKNQ